MKTRYDRRFGFTGQVIVTENQRGSDKFYYIYSKLGVKIESPKLLETLLRQSCWRNSNCSSNVG
jgi:hypothetical protein